MMTVAAARVVVGVGVVAVAVVVAVMLIAMTRRWTCCFEIGEIGICRG